MKITHDLPDNELLSLLRAGDENAFTALYRRRRAGIYRFVLQMCGSRSLAEDITQEVFLILIRGTERFDAGRGSLKSFLYGIARNQLFRRRQRERFYSPLEKSPDQNSGEHLLDDISRNETIESVRKAVLSLPERYREVVVLCDLEEMSYAEAAAILNCAVGTVRSRLHRARAILIEKLRPQASEEINERIKAARCFA